MTADNRKAGSDTGVGPKPRVRAGHETLQGAHSPAAAP